MGGGAWRAQSRLLRACGRPCCYCTDSSRPPDSPRTNVHLGTAARHDPESVQRQEACGCRTDKYSGRAEVYFSAIAPGSAAGCGGKQEDGSPTAQAAPEKRNGREYGGLLRLVPRP